MSANNSLEHLVSNEVSKILIFPRADQKNGPRRIAFYVESDFLKNTRFATAK